MKGLSVREIEKLKREFPKTARLKPRRRPVHHEDAEAIALWEWAQTQPELREYLYHIPNGGRRHAFEAARFQKMGVRSGVHDYHLPIARGGFIGAWIELKSDKKHRPTVSKKQDDWGRKMYGQGHFVCVCYGFEQAKEALEWYLTRPKSITIWSNVNSALAPWFRQQQEGDAPQPINNFRNIVRLPDGLRRK